MYLLQKHSPKDYENFGICCSTVDSDPFHYFMEHMDLAVNFNREDNLVTHRYVPLIAKPVAVNIL